MRKKSVLPALIIGISIFSMLSCKKAIDYINHNPKEDLRACNITKVSFTASMGPEYALFKYNAFGDPLKIIDSVPPEATGTIYNLVFKYDGKRRIKEVDCFFPEVSGIGGEYVNTFHKLFYDNQNRVTVDSAFYYNTLQDYMYRGKSTFVYDNKDRIIKSVDEQSGNGSLSTANAANSYVVCTYNYNAAGNLTTKKFAYLDFDDADSTFRIETRNNYDNKINFLQTNNAWKFICRDYSVNNYVAANTYNSYGLPTTFSLKNGVLFGSDYDQGFYYYFGIENVSAIDYVGK